MGEVHRLPSAAETEREASLWFARMLADDVTADDRVRFEAWRGAHPCSAKAYADLCATWQELVKAGPLVRAVNFGQVMNAASLGAIAAPAALQCEVDSAARPAWPGRLEGAPNTP
jgi:transmembrane sensor